MVLTRSNVRSRAPLSNSGEQDTGESDKFNINHTHNDHSNNDDDKISSLDQDSSEVEVILGTDNVGQDLHEDDLMATIEADDNSSEANLDNKHQTDPDIMGDDFFNQGDEINLDDEINNINNQEEEDYEFNCIKDHKWTEGSLVLDVELTSGKIINIPFDLMKKDRPLELARYIRNHVVENKRGGK